MYLYTWYDNIVMAGQMRSSEPVGAGYRDSIGACPPLISLGTGE